MNVTINREALKNALRPMVRRVVKARVESGKWQHTNHDPEHRPAEWWKNYDFDTGNFIGRRSLETAIQASMPDGGDTITINLIFHIIDMT